MIPKLYFLRSLLLIVVSTLFLNQNVLAQGGPFNCVYSAYLFQTNDVYAVDLASGSSFLAATDVTAGNINAAAYNPADGYIWGYLSSPSKSIVRIGQDFSTTTFTINALTTGNKYVGDISATGMYYFKAGGTTYYTVDLDPNSATYTELTATASLSQNISVHDWAFNAVDGYLYTVEKTTNILYRIDPSNGVVLSLGEVPILSGVNYTYGAVYFDASGRFYVSANQTGTIYMIQNVQDLTGSNAMTSNLFAFGPSSSSNDGARCPTAPVPQEICDNGIDDDGDGLIDCEDPSCSGYGTCDIIDPPTSGGNDGGLESNNRLSNAIAKRNYNRAKNNYIFNRDLAELVEKSSNYGHKASATNFALQGFIPLDVIDEDYVVDSTPFDLLDITNATDVYAVDYIRDSTPIASILSLKTENGVYEHTKYICDRLLGAELISVSTIEINGYHFIKSLIENIDGTVEFVLSLSAKEINGDTEFGVESHWNLDQYEANATFYNFQIWSNSVDDLYVLGQEVLNLLNVQQPVTDYNTSLPPAVFVRKGRYVDGTLELQIVNTNATDSVVFDAGLRSTETSPTVDMTTTINLNGDYLTNAIVDTGYLFDIGFRIGDGIAIPDDLFLSDGPWGVDDAQDDTAVQEYEITANTNISNTDDRLVERNLHLIATTSSYVGTYRAMTPRFQAVDLTEFNTFELRAKGTGNLEIAFVKKSIEVWEDQYKTTILLTDTFQDFSVAFSAFTSPNGGTMVLDDLVTIVFTMTSDDGTLQTKEMDLHDIYFGGTAILGVDTFDVSKEMTTVNYPNPFTGSTTIKLNQPSAMTEITVVDMIGRVVDRQYLTTYQDGLLVQYKAPSLQQGIYSYIITDDASKQYNGRFIIR